MTRGRARSLLALTLLAFSGCEPELPRGPFARAKVIEGLDETIGGDISLARPPDTTAGLPGDFLLENDRFRAAILSGRPSKGPGLYGGSLVDVDKQRFDSRFDAGNGRDQWNEMFPLASMNVPFAGLAGDGGATTVFVPEGLDGSDGGPAVVRVHSPAIPFISLLDLLWSLVQMPDMWLTTDYIAEPGAPWLKIRTTVSFQDRGPVTEGTKPDYPLGGLPVIDQGLVDGIVLGDFFLAGGSLDVFAPGIGFDEDGAVFRRNEAGENIFADPFEFPFVAAVGEGISYGIVAREGAAYVPLFTSSQTAIVSAGVDGSTVGCTDGTALRFCAEDAFTFERYFLIGDGDVGSLVDQYIELRNQISETDNLPELAIPFGTVSGRVVEEGSQRARSGVSVFVFEPGAEYPWSQWLTDVGLDDGTADGFFSGKLPVGTWELLVHEQGRDDGERVTVTVEEGEESSVRLTANRPGVVTFTIRDERGVLVPSKLTVFRADPTAKTSLDPVLGDSFVAGNPEWVVFTEDGTGEVPLPPGEYVAVASRGVEYEIDTSEPFRIDVKTGRQLDLQVIRSIDTTGWISADLHVHSAPSHDSGVSLPMRVTSMVAEGVEFFTSNDHDAIVDFAPVVEEMRMEEWVQTAVGVETTTIEIGHYLAFPLQQEFLGDVGGAMDWTGMHPDEIITNLREQGREAGFEPFVFVAHPRDGILGYFDQFGFDPFDVVAGTDEAPAPPVYDSSIAGLLPNPNPILEVADFTLDIDGLEMFTGKQPYSNRTATVDEVVAYNTGVDETLYPWITRTVDEQEGLINGTILLNDEIEGVIDDWFATLNMGWRITALGNSDSHGVTSIESGCPRNFVMSDVDDPAFLDDQAVAEAIREHHVVASYGPFVQMWMRDGDATAVIGDELDIDASRELQLEIEVQAPTWVDVDRVEIYENGTLLGVLDLAETNGVLRYADSIPVTPTKDSWYVAIVTGDGTMAPVFTEVEIPYIPLDEAVTGALSGIPAVATFFAGAPTFPKIYPIHPYAITNPIWVDVGADGFTAPGNPAWMVPGEVVIP